MTQAKAKQPKTAIDWDAIPHPVFLWGNRHIGHRDPAGHYHEGVFRVFYGQVRREPGRRVYYQLAVTKSTDLVTWTEPQLLTPHATSTSTTPAPATSFATATSGCSARRRIPVR